MKSITSEAVIIGVDTHKDVHVAVALSELGAQFGTVLIPVTTAGYGQLLRWACVYGPVEILGIECTGFYGAGRSRRWSHRVAA